MTAQDDGRALLRDLEAVRKVGVEVMLAVERRDWLHAAAEGETQARGELDRLGVDRRQSTWQGGVEGGDVGVDARAVSSPRPARRRTEIGGWSVEGVCQWVFKVPKKMGGGKKRYKL